MVYQEASASEKFYIVRASLTMQQKKLVLYAITNISNIDIRNMHWKIDIAWYSTRPIINKPGLEAEKQLHDQRNIRFAAPRDSIRWLLRIPNLLIF